MLLLDTTAESLLRDPQYLLRLYHKVIQYLVKCDPSSFARSLSSSFNQIDTRYRVRSREQAIEVWSLKGILRQILPVSVMSDRELSIILAMLPLEEYGGNGTGNGGDDVLVSPVVLLLCLRKMCPVQASLVLEMLRRIDTRPKRPHPYESACGKALLVSARDGRGDACVFERAAILDYLTESYDMTLSEAFFLTDYCSMGLPPSSSTVAIDGSYLYAFLYQRPLPSDVKYPLLMSVFAEAICDPNSGTPLGTLALIEGLHRLSPKPNHGMHREEVFDVNIDTGGELEHYSLTRKSFEDLCRYLRVGLLLEEVHQLFYYLRGESSEELLSAHTLLCEFKRHFVPVSESLFQIVEEAVRRYLVKSGGMLALPRLHLALHGGPLSVARFIDVLRVAGVPEAVSDVELEWLRFKGWDRERLVSLLSGRFPANREALVRQLFDQLKNVKGITMKQDHVEVERVLALFHPEKVEGTLIGSIDDWRFVMTQCFDGNVSKTLTYDQFFYFWRAVSAACSDDSVFTMILWRSFNMHTSR
ncbi:hypothetical protein C3747_226g6 [Trypanosoma cruzi]|uniref:Uncharacterized protein n=2 Tax=Trypanosoma cruzi TaxID=5693 RepID=Q4CVI7_TRYCC|nr:hypothetical protein, conserved [Trypanosoma cruzi]EAN84289.1 hypothetical protein, conserved [Trypanosoma cruzi]PWU98817.1 hypothetical protein C3747_226g6 [Trypanosoma cruzi]RNC44796.1 putative vesicle-fusing ATPase [Trypanosoma cruzi]|eukprot:XP_806140.1 hypothetical protein [Trypanosoma cruzi strain CL Brener]